MKILVVCNYYQPQFAYAESMIAKNLVALGHTVEVITGNRYFPFPNYEDTVKTILGDRVTPVGIQKSNSLTVTRKKNYFDLFARSFFFGIAKKIKEYKPQIVIVFGISTPACIQVALAKKSMSFTFIAVDSHLPSELFSGNIFLKKVVYGLFRIFFANLISENIDKPIAVQEDTRGVITNIYGVTKKVQLISHGTDAQLFSFSKKVRESTRKKLGIGNRDFVIIYVGKLIPSKGVHLLFEAFGLLSSKHKKMSITLLLVGAGPNEYQLECINKVPKEYQNNCIFTGMQLQQTLPTFYSASDVAVWPLQESLAMVDAAAMSLPFIANHTLGARERIANNNALLYKKGDVHDLSTKIEDLMTNEKKRISMGTAGRELVEKNFSWKMRAQAYIKGFT